jgi:uncharacterized heparinase superfamily protein
MSESPLNLALTRPEVEERRAANATPGLRGSWQAWNRLPRDLLLARLIYTMKRPLFALLPSGLSFLTQTSGSINVMSPDPWPGDAAHGGEMTQGRLTFAGRTIVDPQPLWHPREASAAWLAALHGFAWLRDLRACGGDAARRTARDLTTSWIDHNRGWSLPAWRPDIMGRRLVSWLGQYEYFAATADLAFCDSLHGSLQRQAGHLARVLPAGLAGSDLISAIKGLIYAGCCLPGGAAWRRRGLQLLEGELSRQILADGGHVERSPGHHLLILQDLIDIRAVLGGSETEVSANLQAAITSMASVLRLLQHGDGGLALFNHTSVGDSLQIDLTLQRCVSRQRPLMTAPETGFQRLQSGRTTIIVDAGPPPPPGFDDRAHAGTLSFELSVGRDRLIVNCGAQTERTDWYDVQSTTAAHSTLTLAETNSSELLNGLGFGRRIAAVTCRRSEQDGNLLLEMSHDGYLKRFGAIHHRCLYLNAAGDDLRGEDRIEIGAKPTEGLPFTLRFHLHPSVRASQAQGAADVLLSTAKGAGWRLRSSGAEVSLEPSVYLGEPGQVRRGQQVVLTGYTKGSETIVKWALRKEGG